MTPLETEARRSRERSASRSGVHAGLEPAAPVQRPPMSVVQATLILRGVVDRVPDPAFRAEADRALRVVKTEIDRLLHVAQMTQQRKAPRASRRRN